MTSERQHKANKRHAQQSTGPARTGQKNSRKNALKHGILSPQLFLSDENPADFDELCNERVEALHPQDAQQHTFVTKIAMDLWRQRRLDRAEAASIELARQQKLLEAKRKLNGEDSASEAQQEPFTVESFQKLHPFADLHKQFMEEFPKLLPRRAELTVNEIMQLAPNIMGRFLIVSAANNPASSENVVKDTFTFLKELPSGYLDNQELPFWDWAIKEWTKIQEEYAEPEIPHEELIKIASSAPIHNTLISRYQTMLNNQLNKDLKTYDMLQQARAGKPSLIEGTLSSTPENLGKSAEESQNQLNGPVTPNNGR